MLQRYSILFLTLMSAAPFTSAFAAQSPDEIRAGLLSHDRALHIKDGWIRDPYIYLASDSLYYLTGTTSEPGDPREFGDPYNSGLDNPGITGSLKPAVVGTKIRVWRSPDLITWESLGPVFDLRDGFWAEAAPAAFAEVPEEDWRLWAPEVIQLDGKWILVHTSPSPVKQGANLLVSAGGDLTGPWTFPMGAEMRDKHDPSLFRDDDGTVYLLWGNTSIAPLKPGYTGFAAAPVRIDPSDRRIGHEGATLRKIGRKYVHFGTAWSTDFAPGPRRPLGYRGVFRVSPQGAVTAEVTAALDGLDLPTGVDITVGGVAADQQDARDGSFSSGSISARPGRSMVPRRALRDCGSPVMSSA